MEGYEGFASGKPELIGSTEESIRNCVRIFPHRVDGEGHFLALFRKRRRRMSRLYPVSRQEAVCGERKRNCGRRLVRI